MSDKAERVAEQFPDIMLKWYATPGVAMEGEWKKRAIKEIAAIIREEYPDEPTLDQLAKSQGVEPIEDMGTLVIPGLEDDPPIDPAPDVSALREALVLLNRLLCRVNAVTAFHRHKQAIPKSRLDALAETQFEVEEKRSALLHSEPKLGGTV
jgi:hypothetical protein